MTSSLSTSSNLHQTRSHYTSGIRIRDGYDQLRWAWHDLASAVIPEQWNRRVTVW